MKKKVLRFIMIILAVILGIIALLQIPPIGNLVLKNMMKVADYQFNKTADKAELPEGVAVESDIAYVDNGAKEQKLDIYYPEDTTEELPVIIYTHGGGFVSGDKKQTKQYCMTLAKEGYVVFNINYRLAPDSKGLAQVSDVLAALKWVIENSKKYSAKNQIFLAGNSAGAYLSAYTACICTNDELASKLQIDNSFAKHKIKGLLLFNGIYNFKTAAKTSFPFIKSFIGMFLGTNHIKEYEKLDQYSVLDNITKAYPPTFISSGEVDKLHSESEQLLAVLTDHQVLHQESFFDKSEKKAIHDYHLRLEENTAILCLARTLDFLNSQTQ